MVDGDTCDVTFVVTSVASAPSSSEGLLPQPSGTPERARPRTETLGQGSHRGDNCSGKNVSGAGIADSDTAGSYENRERQRGEGQEAWAGGGRGATGGGELETDREGAEKLTQGTTGVSTAAVTTTGSVSCTKLSTYFPAHDTSGSTSSSLGTTSREFRCHRVLFASCSAYFRALLYGGMSESETRRVELRDVTSEGFEAIMRYVYTGKVSVDAANVMDIFSLAHRFGMGELLKACAEVLDECMNCDDVCRVLEAAEYYGHDELAAKCWDLIKDNTPRVLKSESFLELRWQQVLSLVREGELQVDEVELFKAVQAWVSRDTAERRRHVDEASCLSRHFRLPLMSLKELMSVVRPTNLIAADAILDAVTYHADPTRWTGDCLMARPRGKRLAWDASSLAAGAWTADDNRTGELTTSVGDWVGVYGSRVMRSGFHRWSVRANKVGRTEKWSAWAAIVGIARPHSQNSSRPYLPVTGFIAGTGSSKLGGNTAVDEYSSTSITDGDVVTVVYDADGGVVTFFVNGTSLGQAYSGLSGPNVAAIAVNAAGAQWECVDRL
ncbi:unnamed protein product [Ectocarpus sp. 4 AP-2014]